MSEVTRLLDAAAAGDRRAAADLLPLVYDELRKLAAARLDEERPGQTLQPTAMAVTVGLIWALVLASPGIARYTTNRVEVELVPESGLTSAIIYREGTAREAATDWLDLASRLTVELPPGTYRIVPRLAPGRVVDRWEVTEDLAFRVFPPRSPSYILYEGPEPENRLVIEIPRGRRITVRAVTRDAPLAVPSPPSGGG